MGGGYGKKAKDGLNFFPAIRKEPFHLASYNKAMNHVSQETQRQLIMHDVRHLDPSFDLSEMVLVVP